MRPLQLLKTATIVCLTAVSAATLAASPDTFANGQSFFGRPNADTSGSRLVDLGTLKYINVKYGETVTFRSEGKQFTWTFDGLDHLSVDVARIAPSGFAVKPLVIYIALNPSNRN